MRKRILCHRHRESTPSCVVYENSYKCFGCGATGPLSEIGLEGAPKEPRYVEDLQASFEHIKSLPLVPIRGLSFHADDSYYYVCWDGDAYYNRRCRDVTVGSAKKYKCPAGVRRPLFTARATGAALLIIVEGEINALSAAAAYDKADIVSPGGASEFTGARFDSDLEFYKQYKRILILADDDKAGSVAAIKLKIALAPYVSDVSIKLQSADCNDVLVAHGVCALRDEIQHYIDNPGGVRGVVRGGEKAKETEMRVCTVA